MLTGIRINLVDRRSEWRKGWEIGALLAGIDLAFEFLVGHYVFDNSPGPSC